ncbi:hypothetical protein D3C75_668350 [compost metagenome]
MQEKYHEPRHHQKIHNGSHRQHLLQLLLLSGNGVHRHLIYQPRPVALRKAGHHHHIPAIYPLCPVAAGLLRRLRNGTATLLRFQPAAYICFLIGGQNVPPVIDKINAPS